MDFSRKKLVFSLEILYSDSHIVVCIKPPRVLSTDEPGGLPDLLRDALGTRDIRTVHRLDRVVSGVMVLARNAPAASELSRQIRDGSFRKEYLAVLQGCPELPQGTLRDLLYRDKARKMTMVATEPGKGVQEAVLEYWTLSQREGKSLVRILLHTGRTHQIRVQFASRQLPLVGERKYALGTDEGDLALWSYLLEFRHPVSNEILRFSAPPNQRPPWSELF